MRTPYSSHDLHRASRVVSQDRSRFLSNDEVELIFRMQRDRCDRYRGFKMLSEVGLSISQVLLVSDCPGLFRVAYPNLGDTLHTAGKKQMGSSWISAGSYCVHCPGMTTADFLLLLLTLQPEGHSPSFPLVTSKTSKFPLGQAVMILEASTESKSCQPGDGFAIVTHLHFPTPCRSRPCSLPIVPATSWQSPQSSPLPVLLPKE